MKKILFALGIMVVFGHSASAQNSRYAKNYKVCRTETGYGVCADQTTSNLNGEREMPTDRSYLTPEQAEAMKIPCYSPISVASRPPARPVPRVAKETPLSRPNDGMEKNNRRNLNVSNNVPLAPNTGEIR